MALTPDDAVHKQFQHVRFKDGFDPDEVDDYLDEIVIEWRKTIEENNELKAKLAAYESGEAQPVAAAAPVEAEVIEAAPVAAVTTPAADSAVDQSTGLIAIAQRVHDEYVAEGQSKKNQLISEAEARAAELIEAAEKRQREELDRLNSQRGTLETKIKDLEEFESGYRSQLRSYFEGQLAQLDSEQPAADSVSSYGQ